jgi:hypothetical protein
LWKPTIVPDSFHRTPRISRVPTSLGVTDSWTWQSGTRQNQFCKDYKLKLRQQKPFLTRSVNIHGLKENIMSYCKSEH